MSTFHVFKTFETVTNKSATCHDIGDMTGNNERTQNIEGNEIYLRIIIGLLAVLVVLKLLERAYKIFKKHKARWKWYIRKDKNPLKKLNFQSASSDTLDSVLSTKPIITYKAKFMKETIPSSDYNMMPERGTDSNTRNASFLKPRYTTPSSINPLRNEERIVYGRQYHQPNKRNAPSKGTMSHHMQDSERKKLYSLAKNPMTAANVTCVGTFDKPKEIYSLAKAPASELMLSTESTKDLENHEYKGKLTISGDKDDAGYKHLTPCETSNTGIPNSKTSNTQLLISHETKNSNVTTHATGSSVSHVEEVYHLAAATQIVSDDYDLAIPSLGENLTKDHGLHPSTNEVVSNIKRNPTDEESEGIFDVRLSFVVPKSSKLHYEC